MEIFLLLVLEAIVYLLLAFALLYFRKGWGLLPFVAFIAALYAMANTTILYTVNSLGFDIFPASYTIYPLVLFGIPVIAYLIGAKSARTYLLAIFTATLFLLPARWFASYVAMRGLATSVIPQTALFTVLSGSLSGSLASLLAFALSATVTYYAFTRLVRLKPVSLRVFVALWLGLAADSFVFPVLFSLFEGTGNLFATVPLNLLFKTIFSVLCGVVFQIACSTGVCPREE